MSPSFDSPPKGDVHHLARLGRFLVPYRRRIAIALCALVVAASCVLVLGQGLRHVVDAGFGSGDPRLLNAALAAIIAVALLLACATWVRFYLMMSVGERIIADLRSAVFSHVLTLAPGFFDSARTGEIASRLTNDTEQIRQVIGFGVLDVPAQRAHDAGRARAAVPDEPQARRTDRAGRAGHRGAYPRHGTPRAPPLARQPGPRGRRVLAHRRVAARDPHRAGLRARGADALAVLLGGRGGLRHGRAPHTGEGVVDLARDADRFLRGRRDPVDRRTRRVRGPAHRRAALGLHLLRGHRRERRRHRVRGLGRDPARRGLDRAAAGIARHAPGARDRPPADPAAGARHRRDPVRRCHVRVSGAPGDGSARPGLVHDRSRRARRAGRALGRGEVHGVRADSALLRSRFAGACSSTART